MDELTPTWLVRFRRLALTYESVALVLTEKGPVARLAVPLDHPGMLVGWYTEAASLDDVQADVAAAQIEMSQTRHYVRKS